MYNLSSTIYINTLSECSWLQAHVSPILLLLINHLSLITISYLRHINDVRKSFQHFLILPLFASGNIITCSWALKRQIRMRTHFENRKIREKRPLFACRALTKLAIYNCSPKRWIFIQSKTTMLLRSKIGHKLAFYWRTCSRYKVKSDF